jgi:DNA-binding response OmpR family regulator
MDNSKKKILVVEDDNSLRDILVDSLSISSYQVLQAADGEEAVNSVLENKPDLVLLDLLLPKMDGFKVLEKIRHDKDPKVSATKVIVLSNLWSNKDILRAQALQIDEYYVKANTNLPEVFEKIKKIFEGM